MSAPFLMLAVAATPIAAETAHVAVIAKVIRPSVDSPFTRFVVFDSAAATLAYYPRLRVVDRPQMFGSSSTDLGRHIDACSGKLACVVAQLDRAGVQLGLEIIVDAGVNPAFVSTRLIEAKSAKVVGEAISEDAATTVALRTTVRSLLDQQGHRAHGRLVVQTTPIGAQVDVQPSAGIVAGGLHAPGPYRIVATHEGYDGATAAGELRAHETEYVTLRLEESSRSVFASPWLWVVVAGAATAGIVAASSGAPADYTLCQGSNPAACEAELAFSWAT